MRRVAVPPLERAFRVETDLEPTPARTRLAVRFDCEKKNGKESDRRNNLQMIPFDSFVQWAAPTMPSD